MALAVGDIVEGVVTGITKFGAFVQLPEDKSGLVHISEISSSYVEKVSDFLSKGQKVRVKILLLDETGKISLSMKLDKPKTKKSTEKPERPRATKPAEINWMKDEPQSGMSFEDKLSKFLKDSNEKMEVTRSRENQRLGSRNRRHSN